MATFWQHRSQRRLAIALGLSVMAHFWFVQGYGTAPRARPASAGTQLSVLLEPAPVVEMVPAQQPPVSEARRTADAFESAEIATRRIVNQPAENPSVLPPHGVTTARMQPTTDSAAALPQPQDPTYYTARSLDVFPKALTGLNLAPYLNAQVPANARMRATLLIDETGTVNEVTGMEADPVGVVEVAAREMLLRAHFTPAQKDGRIVKAQVLVSIEY